MQTSFAALALCLMASCVLALPVQDNRNIFDTIFTPINVLLKPVVVLGEFLDTHVGVGKRDINEMSADEMRTVIGAIGSVIDTLLIPVDNLITNLVLNGALGKRDLSEMSADEMRSVIGNIIDVILPWNLILDVALGKRDLETAENRNIFDTIFTPINVLLKPLVVLGEFLDTHVGVGKRDLNEMSEGEMRTILDDVIKVLLPWNLMWVALGKRDLETTSGNNRNIFDTLLAPIDAILKPIAVLGEFLDQHVGGKRDLNEMSADKMRTVIGAIGSVIDTLLIPIDNLITNLVLNGALGKRDLSSVSAEEARSIIGTLLKPLDAIIPWNLVLDLVLDLSAGVGKRAISA